MLTLILNVLWFILGGFIAGLGWLLASLILAITIIGIPFVPATLRIAGFSFFPFGKHIVPREELTGREDLGTGAMGLILNIIWIVFAGWWLALAHITIGFGLCCTIIGIPFGWQHFKLALLALAPVGKTIVDAPGPHP
jgi:uncharacterized membrane protein YccF (DUF307 family)